jgi:hypothetical protein
MDAMRADFNTECEDQSPREVRALPASTTPPAPAPVGRGAASLDQSHHSFCRVQPPAPP